MQQILLKEFQQDLFYNNDNNILLIENETSNISLIIKSNIYIDNSISTTVNISFKYKTSLESTYKIKSTSINFNYCPVPVTFYLNTDSSKLYIKNFKIEFLYNGKYYETDQDFFRDFNCFNIYTEDNANNYDIYIDTNIGIMDEDSYNSMQHPLMIEAIVDGYIHLMPHNNPIYIEPETPRIWYKIDDGDYNELFRENNDNDEVEDILVGHGNLEDDNPFNDYHHYVIPIKQGETIYLFSPNLDRMVLVFFSTKKNEERWDEDIEVEVYNEQQIDDDIDDMTANELLAQIQALNTKIQTLESNISGKQNTISDLNTIRNGAALGATAIQQHQDLSNYATINYVDSSITSVYNYINSSQENNENTYNYYKSQPLTFEILEDGEIKWCMDNIYGPEHENERILYSKTISYSKDNGITWININSNDINNIIYVNKNDKILFKGNNNSYGVFTCIDNSGINNWYIGNHFETNVKCNISGNIMSLINSNNFENLIELTEILTFYNLFTCFNLISAKNLILPATILSEMCYRSMFSDCKSLIDLPYLPADNLTSGCYRGMFSYCRSLINIPKNYLHSINLASDCYSGMFYYCIKLLTVPELPATTLASSCYSSMFEGCYALTSAPTLPATTLAPKCYDRMFCLCLSLIVPPELPAMNLADNCYEGMFEECLNLIYPPELPATILPFGCYRYMFTGCERLFITPVFNHDLEYLGAYSCNSMFMGCKNLQVCLFGFKNVTLEHHCCENMFSGCTSLRSAPELSVTTLDYECYKGMFRDCTSLIRVHDLPATTLVEDCYEDMFDGCTSLTEAPELPATTLAPGCYSGMFKGCISLTEAPELPATTLVNRCYVGMFDGCVSLNYIKCLATDISAENCTNFWTNGVPSSGTFVKASGMNLWQINENGIPSGWTVEDAA